MTTKDDKKEIMEMAIQSDSTEAWANIEKIEKPSNVSIPSLLAVECAKEYVEENQL